MNIFQLLYPSLNSPFPFVIYSDKVLIKQYNLIYVPFSLIPQNLGPLQIIKPFSYPEMVNFWVRWYEPCPTSHQGGGFCWLSIFMSWIVGGSCLLYFHFELILFQRFFNLPRVFIPLNTTRPSSLYMLWWILGCKNVSDFIKR